MESIWDNNNLIYNHLLFRKSNEEATAIFDLRIKDINLMEAHLKETEEILAKTKNKIGEVASIKAWLCKERDRPGD